MHKNFAQKPNFYLVRDSIFLKIMTSLTSILAFRANRQSLTTSIYFSPATLHASVDNQWVDCPGFTLINDIYNWGNNPCNDRAFHCPLKATMYSLQKISLSAKVFTLFGLLFVVSANGEGMFLNIK